MKLTIPDDLPFSLGFEGFKDLKDWKPREIPPCTDPRGHLWEEGSTVLLSCPPQHPVTCVHCGAYTTWTEPQRPAPKRYTDDELKRKQNRR